MFTNTKRILRSGVIQFWRSSFVSISSIFVMIITLSVITSMLFANALLKHTLDEIQSKVDINIYFVTGASEAQVLKVKTDLEQMPEVAGVTYISREQALAQFKEKHAKDTTILQSLEEVGTNPLGAVLNVLAKNPSQYETIAEHLNGQSTVLSADVTTNSGTNIIEKINYQDNKTAIDRLSKIIDAGGQFGVILMIVLIALSVIITFNTIRLAIYISRDEISVMKLVGASNKYIRGPFVVTGILCGLAAAILTLVIFYPLLFWLGGQTAAFFAGFNVFQYYIDNVQRILGIVLGSGIVIGALSSWLAVRKYLN